MMDILAALAGSAVGVVLILASAWIYGLIQDAKWESHDEWWERVTGITPSQAKLMRAQRQWRIDHAAELEAAYRQQFDDSWKEMMGDIVPLRTDDGTPVALH